LNVVKSILPLYGFQRQALDALKERWKEDEAQRLAIVIPTGGGKTVTFSHQIKEYLEEHPDKRVLVLVDRDSIARQSVNKIKSVAPYLSVGIVKARENETTADVIVGSVQTLRNPARMKQLRNVGLVIVDECDLASAPSYISVLTYFGCFNPDSGVRAVGYTATLYRTDGRIGAVWQDVAFSRDISWMIRKGFLIPPRGISIQVPDLNLASVKSTRKDFSEGELGEALAESLAPEKVAEAIMEHASDRKVLAFFPTVASSYVFAEAITAAGMPAEVIHGGMSQAEQDAVLARHKRGTCVVNCMILTVGYDDPEVDCIVMGRPTKSKRLYVQIVGRGLRVDLSRPYEEQDCLLLSVTGGDPLDLRTELDLSDKPLDPSKIGKGRTLTELEDEFDAGEGVDVDEVPVWRGDTEAVVFDPLGTASARAKVWIKTSAGVYFVPAGKSAYVFIMEWPAAGRWTVGFCSKKHTEALDFCSVDSVPLECDHDGCNTKRAVGTTLHRGIPLEEAMVWAEDLATDLGAASLNTASKSAPWRKKEASEKMKNMARGLGISLPAGVLRAGEVSDLIAKIEGTRRIDPLVRKVGGITR
jgi:superfamily II DNA or RNA helicase